MKSIINKKAKFHYSLGKELEAGIVLTGSEVKSIKTGRADISNAYVSIRKNEIFLINASISKYKFAGNIENYDPLRDRKLLLHKREIFYLQGKLNEKGLTLVPLKLYTKKGRIKILVACAKGKSKFDKRETIKKRESSRRIERAMKQNF